MTREKLQDYTASNRDAWNASAVHHRAAASWAELTTAAARPGFSVLDATLTDTLARLDPQGKTVGQICCNNARELLSTASLGAVPLWGVDGAAAFLEQGAELAGLAGLSPRLICADVYDLPHDIPPVDLLLITIGVLNWMPDLPRFLGVVAGLIAPGGQLVIYEAHPVLEMFDPGAADPFTPQISYFETAPFVETRAITYDGTEQETGVASYWFQHSLGAVVTGVAQAGLRVERLTEHPHSNRELAYDIYENRPAQVPMCYTLVATALP